MNIRKFRPEQDAARLEAYLRACYLADRRARTWLPARLHDLLYRVSAQEADEGRPHSASYLYLWQEQEEIAACLLPDIGDRSLLCDLLRRANGILCRRRLCRGGQHRLLVQNAGTDENQLAQRHIQRHHQAEADGEQQHAHVGVLSGRHVGDQLLDDHIEHGARGKAQKIRHCRHDQARSQHGQQAEHRLDRAREHPVEEGSSLAHPPRHAGAWR